MPKIKHLNQNTPEWHEWRLHHLGGSDAATVMFLNPYRDPYKLWLEKTGRTPPQRDWSNGVETPAQRGLRLEPEARQLYCMQRACFAPPACIENDREGEEFMAASLDGLADDRIIEIKCPTDARIHLMAREGSIPAEYYAQVMHNVQVAGVERADYVSYYHDDLIIIPVERDEKFLEELVSTEKLFWSWVQDNCFPFPADNIVVDLANDREALESINRLLDFRRMKEDVEEKERIELATLKRRLVECGKAIAPNALLHWERRRGWIQWREIPEVQALLKSGIDLEAYRGPDVLSFRVERK